MKNPLEKLNASFIREALMAYAKLGLIPSMNFTELEESAKSYERRHLNLLTVNEIINRCENTLFVLEKEYFECFSNNLFPDNLFEYAIEAVVYKLSLYSKHFFTVRADSVVVEHHETLSLTFSSEGKIYASGLGQGKSRLLDVMTLINQAIADINIDYPLFYLLDTEDRELILLLRKEQYEYLFHNRFLKFAHVDFPEVIAWRNSIDFNSLPF